MDTFEKDEPVLSTGEFVGTEILFVLPIIGLFVAIIASIFAKNITFKNYAKAHVILWILFLIFMAMAYIGGNR